MIIFLQNFDRKRLVWAALISLITLNACQTTPQTKNQNNTALVFFDLKGYFQQEIQRLNEAQPSVVKIVAINDQTETKTLAALDFRNELNVFLQSDINRPDWFDKYRVDSIRQNGQLSALHYEALDNKLRTRAIDVVFNSQKVMEIRIKNGGQTLVASAVQDLVYQPDRGYSIVSRQHTALAKDKTLNIEVRFKTPVN